MKISSVALSLVLVALPAIALAQERSEVKFAPGNFGTMVTGSIKGHDYIDYLLGASAGQKMFIELASAGSTGNGTIYFNLLPPGSDGVAIYNGSIEGNSTTVTLPETGTYAIRVYQMGNDKDAGKATSFTLDLSIQ